MISTRQELKKCNWRASITKHTKISKEKSAERIVERGKKFASSYHTKIDLLDSLEKMLSENKDQINDWLHDSETNRLTLDLISSHNLGHIVFYGEKSARPANTAKVILKRQGTSFFVLTSTVGVENKKTELKSLYQDIWQLTNSYFHEDVNSIEEGISDLIQNTGSKYKDKLVKVITQFIEDSNFSIKEKNEFIENNISFFLNTAPLTWLQNILDEMNKQKKGGITKEFSLLTWIKHKIKSEAI